MKQAPGLLLLEELTSLQWENVYNDDMFRKFK